MYRINITIFSYVYLSQEESCFLKIKLGKEEIIIIKYSNVTLMTHFPITE